MEGREPEGIVAAKSTADLASELTEALKNLRGPSGEILNTHVYQPQQIYREVRGISPDLIVHFDDLAYRAIGSIGHPTLYLAGNDQGRDHANHAQHGVVILRDGRGPHDASLYDIAPTLLDRLGLPIPVMMRGRSLLGQGHPC